jgi:hypothetical protein
MKPVVFVVGDQYEAFAQASHVLTESQLRDRARCDSSLCGVRVVKGQGVSTAANLAALDQSADPLGIEIASSAPLAPLGATHKHDSRFVLITEPRCVKPLVYEAELVVNELMDRLADHVTGRHVSGMILVEAARQAGIASVEIENAHREGPRMSFVLNSMTVRFTRFAFPLPATIRVRVGKEDGFIEIIQANEVVCELEIQYRFLPEKVLAALEAKAARRAVDAAARLYVEAELPRAANENNGL